MEVFYDGVFDLSPGDFVCLWVVVFGHCDVSCEGDVAADVDDFSFCVVWHGLRYGWEVFKCGGFVVSGGLV